MLTFRDLRFLPVVTKMRRFTFRPLEIIHGSAIPGISVNAKSLLDPLARHVDLLQQLVTS
jgi:hypothetical protein